MRRALVLAACLLSACASGTPAPVDIDWLTGTWAITDINGAAQPAPSEEAPGPGLIFNPRTVGGYSDCNSFSGGFTLSGGALRITDFSSTELACNAEEGVLYDILKAAPAISRVDDDEMRLKGANGRSVEAKRMLARR